MKANITHVNAFVQNIQVQKFEVEFIDFGVNTETRRDETEQSFLEKLQKRDSQTHCKVKLTFPKKDGEIVTEETEAIAINCFGILKLRAAYGAIGGDLYTDIKL